MVKLFAISSAQAAERLDTTVERAIDDGAIRNAVLHVDAPRAGLWGTWAAGVADARVGEAMQANTPFLSASIGKLAMAATAFRLAAEGLIDVDAPRATWVPPDALAGLPVVGGDAAVGRITVRMLLANRSGLPDYYDSDTQPPHDGAPSLAELMVSEPQRTWTREGLIDYTRQHYTPVAAPGERFLYSDLNWDLLGLVFEGAVGRPFHELVHEYALDPLAMAHTWYHAFEPVPDGAEDFADVFFGDVNLARAPSLSLDQAGGGLATTAEDLGRLVRGLEGGVPVEQDRLATDWTENAMSRGLDYGYGTWRWRPGRIFPLAFQLPQLIGVSGSTNSFAYRSAKGDVITGTLDQADDPSRHVRFLLSKVLPLLQRLK